MQIVAKQQDKELREQFAIDVSLYQPHMLMFVDETGRDAMRKYGYGLRGKPPRSCKLLVRERVSVITAMNEEGILVMKVVWGTVNGDDFLDFIQRDLLLTLMPFDGTNPYSIVILDNCSVHHVSGVASMITDGWCTCPFLAPLFS